VGNVGFVALRRYSEAEPLIRLGRDLGYKQDVLAQMMWRQAQAPVHASRGEHSQAEQLAREAVAMSKATDALDQQGDALCDLAAVLRLSGHTEESAAALKQALEHYERKHNAVMARNVRKQLA
jgi:tetratricopeptide (TPR) repeat protein